MPEFVLYHFVCFNTSSLSNYINGGVLLYVKLCVKLYLTIVKLNYGNNYIQLMVKINNNLSICLHQLTGKHYLILSSSLILEESSERAQVFISFRFLIHSLNVAL